ncbi:MAG: hypothetical protein EHM58_12090 [Ignavibacteriae bacterium]|nr:MAG: hypothetical protein EHM58_12090 [Ignavibacteriota bacterium]
MQIIKEKTPFQILVKEAEEYYGDMVKAVVDVEREIMAIGGELHSDEEAMLLDDGSLQQNLWGINIWINKDREEWIEFDSMINIRPRQNNRSKGVESSETREKIINIINNLV